MKPPLARKLIGGAGRARCDARGRRPLLAAGLPSSRAEASLMRRFVPVVVACLAVSGLAVAGFSFAAVTATDGLGTTTNVTVHIREWSFDLSQETVPIG